MSAARRDEAAVLISGATGTQPIGSYKEFSRYSLLFLTVAMAIVTQQLLQDWVYALCYCYIGLSKKSPFHTFGIFMIVTSLVLLLMYLLSQRRLVD